MKSLPSLRHPPHSPHPPPYHIPLPYSRFFRITSNTPYLAKSYYSHPKHPGKKVILFGNAHIASDTFYRSIQKHLERLAVVLTEGVRLEESLTKKVEKFRKSVHQHGAASVKSGKNSRIAKSDPILKFESTRYRLADALNLVSQENGIFPKRFTNRSADIDYKLNPIAYENFVNMERLLVQDHHNKISTLADGQVDSLLESDRRGDRETGLLLALTASMRPMPSLLEEVYVKSRNRIAMQHFDEVIKKTTSSKEEIGILYGVRHAADFHNRLTRRGWKMTAQRWSPLWKRRVAAASL